MANKEVFELTAASPLDGTELLYVVQGGNSRKSTTGAVAALVVFADQATAEAGIDEEKALNPLGGSQLAAARDARLLHVRDQKANGTAGGASSVGTQVRALNTVVTNGIAGASLASNQITLPAGTYDAEIYVPSASSNRSKAWLRVVTVGTIVLNGMNNFTEASAAGSYGILLIKGRFTLASTTVLEIAHYCQSAQATNGLGIEASSGQPEIYTEVFIKKVD